MFFNNLTYKPFGEKAILIEWPAIIREDTLYDIIRYKKAILDHSSEAIEDSIIGYHSLTVKYESALEDYEKTKHTLEALYITADQKSNLNTHRWEIPVCYDVQFGLDLEYLSTHLGLSAEEIIERHTKAIYTVYFIGFLPGFLYLGGLDERLHVARKDTPRLRVPKGAVAIGGQQTGIYPMQSAGGWNIIGNTPILLFDATKETPCFAQSGDNIKFSPVSLEEYEEIKEMVNQGTYELTKTLIHA
jgi:inhibitor of KinA